MKELNLKEVQKINEALQKLDHEMLAASPQLCYQTAILCGTWKAFTSEQIGIAKKDWSDAKVKAYQNFLLSNESNAEKVEKYGVMVVKDFINAKCGEYEARFLFIERTNNACGEIGDILRTVISALKQEMYANR